MFDAVSELGKAGYWYYAPYYWHELHKILKKETLILLLEYKLYELMGPVILV